MNMEYKLITAVSGFPSLYNSSSLTYRDVNMRSDAWRRVSEMVGVPEFECRKKWKTLRDQHRRERQRERKIRDSGIGFHNYRPWRYSSVLAFLNPFIEARAAGPNGWALDLQHSHGAELMGCSTTVETRSEENDNYGYAITDAPTAISPSSSTSSSLSSSMETQRKKRSSSVQLDVNRLKEPKIEMHSDDGTSGDKSVQIQDNANMREVLQAMLPSVTSLSTPLASSYSSSQPADRPDIHRISPPQPSSWSSSRLNHLKAMEKEGVEQLMNTDEEDVEEEVEEEVEGERHRPISRLKQTNMRSMEGLLGEFLRRMEVQRVRELEQRDDVILFLLSLAPALRRLTAEKQSWVRTKMQQFLHEAEFGPTDFH